MVKATRPETVTDASTRVSNRSLAGSWDDERRPLPHQRGSDLALILNSANVLIASLILRVLELRHEEPMDLERDMEKVCANVNDELVERRAGLVEEHVADLEEVALDVGEREGV
ncbi:hypothetical protein MRB53_003016 [Persea americana]|uniref:Uncharacterized protein n=1 Tax=Persea americana TaxID=3435 RepID=A0ACC2MX31_PERAE|nr:hypothetical protein MRB53_003016 [Persea americana]